MPGQRASRSRAKTAATRIEPHAQAGPPRAGDNVGAAVAIDVADDDSHDLIGVEMQHPAVGGCADDELGPRARSFDVGANAVTVEISVDNLRGYGPRQDRQDHDRPQDAEGRHSFGL